MRWGHHPPLPDEPRDLVQYWADRARVHARNAIICAVLACTCAAVAIILVFI